MRSVVALVEARPETIVEDYQRVLDLAGWSQVPPDDPVALVVRGGTGAWKPGTVSPPWQLDGTLSWLGGRDSVPGKAPVVLAIGGAGGPAATEAWGWPEVMARHGADHASDHFRGRRSFRAEPDLPALRSSLPKGLTLPAGLRDRATLLLPVPTLVKERPVAGAVRLLTDLMAPGLSLPRGVDGIEARTEVLRFARQALPSLAVVMDAVHWKVGPDTAVARNVLLAGTDPVAVDAVATRLAGRSTARNEFFRACRDENLGAVREEDIRLVGRVDLMGREFDVPEKYVGGKLPDWLRKPADRILGAALARTDSQQRHLATPWGRLFTDYRSSGAVGESR
jgi:hypothetical protein